MQEALMKDIYVKANTDENNKKKGNVITGIYYYFKIRKIAKKYDYSKSLTRDSDVCNGEVVLKNTRIRPETIAKYFLNKMNTNPELTMDDITKMVKKDYPAVKEKMILASLLYYFKTKKIFHIF